MYYCLENELEQAIVEEDIMSFRKQLEAFRPMYLNHTLPFYLIESYRENDLEKDEKEVFEKMRQLSPDLDSLVLLSNDVDNALEEEDVVSLRSILSKIVKPATASIRKLKYNGSTVKN